MQDLEEGLRPRHVYRFGDGDFYDFHVWTVRIYMSNPSIIEIEFTKMFQMGTFKYSLPNKRQSCIFICVKEGRTVFPFSH